ncbi:MAG: hypothetical protein LBQ47_08580 [Endomicrobium sp.]|jgi:hypothetical protein|nr:hypothetical protein [Endomicrobium sp.]
MDFSIKNVFQKAFETVKKNVFPFLVLVIAFTVIFILEFITAASGDTLRLIVNLFSSFFVLCAFSFILNMCRQSKDGDFTSFVLPLGAFLRIIILSVIAGIILIPAGILAGLLLSRLYAHSYINYVILLISFFAACIYFSVRFAFIVPAYIDNMDITEGIGHSFNLTRGNFVKLAFLFIICFLVTAIGEIGFVLVTVTWPLVLIIYACAYLQLHGNEDLQETETSLDADPWEAARNKYKQKSPKDLAKEPKLERTAHENSDSYLGEDKNKTEEK